MHCCNDAAQAIFNTTAGMLGRTCSERRKIPHQLRRRSTSRYTARCSEEVKLTMIVEVGVQYLCLRRELMEALGTNLCDPANSLSED